jgi:hypothetical protein
MISPSGRPPAAAPGTKAGAGPARRSDSAPTDKQREGGLSEEAAREGRCRHEVARPDHGLRPDDPGREPACITHAIARGLKASEAVVDGGKAVALHEGGVEAREAGAEAEDQERGERDAGAATEPASVPISAPRK